MIDLNYNYQGKRAVLKKIQNRVDLNLLNSIDKSIELLKQKIQKIKSYYKDIVRYENDKVEIEKNAEYLKKLKSYKEDIAILEKEFKQKEMMCKEIFDDLITAKIELEKELGLLKSHLEGADTFEKTSVCKGARELLNGFERGEDFVIFRATIYCDGKDASFTEKSHFIQKEGRWYYDRGEMISL